MMTRDGSMIVIGVRPRNAQRRMLCFGLLSVFVGLTLLVGHGAAQAEFGDGVAIHEFKAYPTTTQAGGHPDFWLEFDIDNRVDPQMKDPSDPSKAHPCACNDAKDIVVNLPPGFIGNPHATPRCTAKEFAFNECPIDSQVGLATPTGCLGASLCASFPNPIYNLVPPPDEAGLTGFKIILFDAPVYTFLTARTGSDYGLRATVRGAERVFPIPNHLQVIWGVPADPIHDAMRFEKSCILICTPPLAPPTTGYPSNSPLIPFLSNPTACGEPLESSIDILAYDGGRTHATAPWPATTGCAQIDFNPSLAAKPTTTSADTASGVDVVLTVPQTLSPTVPSPSSIRATTVKFPPGFSINPNAADGKTSCSDAAARFGTEEQAQCPEFAKVGTLDIHSAVLPGVLPGAVYLGDPLPGNRYRLFLVADGFGLHIKLPGQAILDRQSGQITVSFKDLPQTPFEKLDMHLFGSERGILATPTRCGTYPVESTFTPWNDELPDQKATQFFTIDSGPGNTPCPGASRPFAPTFKATSAGNTAGSFEPYGVDIARADGDQFLTGLNVATPPGFSGKLAGVPYCPDASVAAVSNPLYSGLSEMGSSVCPAASQVGTVVAGAGAGSRPLYQDGKLYLAGPYKGAPLSLLVVVPAVSGPYDLGNIAVRVAVHVDPVTARVSTVSDPLPQIIEGIPLRVRSIRVNVNRPNFALNPTNCLSLSSLADIFGDEFGQVRRSTHFQVANCANLKFGPRLGLKLRGATKRTGHPALQAVLRAEPGEANIGRTVVTLSHNTLIDNAHIRTICTRVQFAADACPAAARYGRATAHSPLLDNPLSGPVYLRSSDNPLPDLVADLRGQINVELSAKVDAKNGRLRTTFANVPDVPVRKFVLRMQGGDKGLIVNSENLCRRDNRARAVLVGQNGARQVTKPELQASCGKKRQSKGRKNRAIVFRSRKAD